MLHESDCDTPKFEGELAASGVCRLSHIFVFFRDLMYVDDELAPVCVYEMMVHDFPHLFSCAASSFPENKKGVLYHVKVRCPGLRHNATV